MSPITERMVGANHCTSVIGVRRSPVKRLPWTTSTRIDGTSRTTSAIVGVTT